MADLKMDYGNGRVRPLTLPEQFMTRFIEFDGLKFEKQKDDPDGLTYKVVGEAPHTTLHGGKSKGKATLKVGGEK